MIEKLQELGDGNNINLKLITSTHDTKILSLSLAYGEKNSPEIQEYIRNQKSVVLKQDIASLDDDAEIKFDMNYEFYSPDSDMADKPHPAFVKKYGVNPDDGWYTEYRQVVSFSDPGENDFETLHSTLSTTNAGESIKILSGFEKAINTVFKTTPKGCDFISFVSVDKEHTRLYDFWLPRAAKRNNWIYEISGTGPFYYAFGPKERLMHEKTNLSEIEKIFEDINSTFNGDTNSTFSGTTNNPAPQGTSSSKASNSNTQELESSFTHELEQQGLPNADRVAQDSIDLSVNQMPPNENENDPNFWPEVLNNARKLANPTASNGVQAPQSVTQGSSMTHNNSMFSQPTNESIEAIYKRIEEDNFYNHNSIRPSQSTSASNFSMGKTDKFEWTLSSNKGIASAIVYEHNHIYSARFRLIPVGSTLWTKQWDPLKDAGVKAIVRINIDLMSMDASYARSDDSKPIISSDFAGIGDTMVKVVKSYQKLWGKNYQYIVFSSSNSNKSTLILRLAKALDSASIGYKFDPDLSENVSSHMLSRSFYIILKSKTGLKEDEGGDAGEADSATLQSSSFINELPNGSNETIIMNGRKISKDSARHIKQMQQSGFGVDLSESTHHYLSVGDTIPFKMGNSKTPKETITISPKDYIIRTNGGLYFYMHKGKQYMLPSNHREVEELFDLDRMHKFRKYKDQLTCYSFKDLFSDYRDGELDNRGEPIDDKS